MSKKEPNHWEWVEALKNFKRRDYWNKPNTVEFIAFMVKIIIIVPGLVFNVQWWWLYIFALGTSLALIWSSTKKTLPTIIVLNIAWVFIAVASIVKYFAGW